MTAPAMVSTLIDIGRPSSDVLIPAAMWARAALILRVGKVEEPVREIHLLEGSLDDVGDS
jgi:hypothetical protein